MSIPYRVRSFENKCIVEFVSKPTELNGNTVKDILLSRVDYNLKYAVPFSGGIDSECVVELLKDAKADVVAYIMDMFVDGIHLNGHDTNIAKDYCDKNDVPYVVVNNNLDFFLENDLYDYSVTYRSTSPQLSAHLWLFDQIPSNRVIYTSGDMISYGHENKVVRFKEYKYLYTHRYFDKTGRLYIPLMDGSDEIINEVLKYKILTENNCHERYQYKCSIYKHLGFSAEPKEDKYTGFEHIRQYYSDKYNEQYTIREFNNRYRAPLEAIIKEPEMSYIYPKYMTEMIERLKNV